MSISYYDKLGELLAANTPFVSVTIVDTTGSVPQDAGSKMLVTRDGLHFGTVGGGKVEKRAIEEAQAMLSRSGAGASADPSKSTHFVNWSLDRDIGMTCGGMVKLYFEAYNTTTWNVVVFGAGHVANALISLLVNLECRVTCYDSRPDWLAKLPNSPKLKRVLSQDLPAEVQAVPDSAFVLLITMGHTTDRPILLKALETKHFSYLGVIGSAAKSARLRKDIAEAGMPADYAQRYFCPVGLDIGSNHPQEIAISIVAQLLQERDRVLGRKRHEHSTAEVSS